MYCQLKTCSKHNITSPNNCSKFTDITKCGKDTMDKLFEIDLTEKELYLILKGLVKLKNLEPSKKLEISELQERLIK